MSKYQQHQNKLNTIVLHLQKKFPAAKFYNRHVGLFYSMRIMSAVKSVKTISDFKSFMFSAKNKYLVSINKAGMSDVYMIIPINVNGKILPIHLELEIKTGCGKLSKDQLRWKKICGLMHVKFIEARCELDVEKEINEYIKELQL